MILKLLKALQHKTAAKICWWASILVWILYGAWWIGQQHGQTQVDIATKYSETK